ncbi:hypothetical protein D3C86_1860770 [compost metagenome]
MFQKRDIFRSLTHPAARFTSLQKYSNVCRSNCKANQFLNLLLIVYLLDLRCIRGIQIETAGKEAIHYQRVQ